MASIKVWEVQFDRAKKQWYADESKGTYPMTVSVPSGKEGSIVSDQVGHKVTDAERALLGKWKRTGQG